MEREREREMNKNDDTIEIFIYFFVVVTINQTLPPRAKRDTRSPVKNPRVWIRCFSSPRRVALPRLMNSLLNHLSIAEGRNKWGHTFFKTISFVQELNLSHWIHFLLRYLLHYVRLFTIIHSLIVYIWFWP